MIPIARLEPGMVVVDPEHGRLEVLSREWRPTSGSSEPWIFIRLRMLQNRGLMKIGGKGKGKVEVDDNMIPRE